MTDGLSAGLLASVLVLAAEEDPGLGFGIAIRAKVEDLAEQQVRCQVSIGVDVGSSLEWYRSLSNLSNRRQLKEKTERRRRAADVDGW